MITTTEGERGFFFDEADADKVWWSLTPDKAAKIVKSEEECELYDTLYAVEYDIDDMSMQDLLKILHRELSKKEVETVCKQEKWLGKRYSDFLQNPLKDEELLKELKEIERKADGANSMAALAAITGMIK